MRCSSAIAWSRAAFSSMTPSDLPEVARAIACLSLARSFVNGWIIASRWSTRKTAMNVFRNRARRASIAARRSLGIADRGDDLAAVEDRDEVIRAMRPLTAHQRAALVLTGYLGFTSEEAAQVLGVRASTVRALATKGRATARATAEGRR